MVLVPYERLPVPQPVPQRYSPQCFAPPPSSQIDLPHIQPHVFMFLPQRFLLCVVRPPHVKFSEINPDFLVSNPFLFFMYMKELSSPSVHIYMQQPPHCLTMYMYLLTVIPFAHTHKHTHTQPHSMCSLSPSLLCSNFLTLLLLKIRFFKA